MIRPNFAFTKVWTRFSSTLTYTSKPIPSKAHLHRPLPDDSFPSGYALTGFHCGIKKNGLPDLAIVLSTSSRPTSAAGCFTRNAFKAAPVLVSEEVLAKNEGRIRALVVNSGCANAVTGKQGLEDAWSMIKATDALLDPPPPEPSTLVMSTGVIGQNLPISKIVTAISSASDFGVNFQSWESVAKAFMTTDMFPKLRSRIFTIRDKEYRLAGIDKGAGMIHPNMGPPSQPSLHATLLGFILTDAAVSPQSLQTALNYAVDRSFNSISVDGDMSTNDTIIAMANGAADPDSKEIDEDSDPEAYEIFRNELTSFSQELAKLIVRDGEGATKLVTVTVEGAATFLDAHKIASKISTSALVKTAMYGEDANWGRILASMGSLQTLDQPLNPSLVTVSFVPSDGSARLPVLVNGEPEKVDEVRAKEILSRDEFEVHVQLGMGSESAKYWTCDFSYEYVRINGDYRS